MNIEDNIVLKENLEILKKFGIIGTPIVTLNLLTKYFQTETTNFYKSFIKYFLHAK